MAARKTTRKAGVASGAKISVAKAVKTAASNKDGSGKSGVPVEKRAKTASLVQMPARHSGLPSARECPLVLDGEVDAADFSPKDCLACDEFDCRFCATVQGSGSLRSRLFASNDGDRPSDGDDGWGDDTDTDADDGEDADEDDVEEGEDLL